MAFHKERFELVKGCVLILGGVLLSIFGFVGMFENINTLSDMDLIRLIIVTGFGMFCVINGFENIKGE